MNAALVLFSGGQDSTTSLYWAKAKWPALQAVAFDYGQRHKVELGQAAIIGKLAGVPLKIIRIPEIPADSALTNPQDNLNTPHARDESLPATFVPGRNLLFLSLAASYAFQLGIHDLVTGVCHTDYSGYPDCRREFIDAAEKALSLAMAPHAFTIHTPIMDLDKADTFKLAADLGVLDIVLEHSHTDYNGDRTERHPWGYGKLDNDASRLRAKGFEEFNKRYPPRAST